MGLRVEHRDQEQPRRKYCHRRGGAGSASSGQGGERVEAGGRWQDLGGTGSEMGASLDVLAKSPGIVFFPKIY